MAEAETSPEEAWKPRGEHEGHPRGPACPFCVPEAEGRVFDISQLADPRRR